MSIQVQDLVHRYAKDAAPAVDRLSLEVPSGSFQVLLGPSGCGKTTTMRCIAGLEEPEAGRIVIDDRVVVDPEVGVHVAVHKRQVGMVFQSYAIWPHKTVEQNVAFPLRMQRVDNREVDRRVDEVLDAVGLLELRKRGASALSGGQMQRVALARSMAMRPRVLLFDEPLSNLDARLRDSLRFELRSLQQAYGFTALYVTHDQSEALALGDDIAVMRDGVTVQQGGPRELCTNPNSEFVARFLGVGNILSGHAQPLSGASEADVDVPSLQASLRVTSRETGEVILCIRQEAIQLRAMEGDAGSNEVEAIVDVTSFLGSEVHYQCVVGEGTRLQCSMPAQGSEFRPGDRVFAAVPPEAIHVVPKGT